MDHLGVDQETAEAIYAKDPEGVKQLYQLSHSVK
jgi:hypothetical protein